MQFVLMAWDGEDEHALARRMAVRETHMVRARQAAKDGLMLEAGAVLNDAGQMIGSVMMLEFPSELEARAWLEADVYVTTGVWQRWELHPFRVAALRST
jgi:uncharacterized protein